MSRATVRKVFVTGLVVWVVGGVLLLLSNSGHPTNNTVYSAGLLLAGIGAVIAFVSWIMALIASAVLGRWGWFVIVLILGLIAMPLVMIIYSLIGPTTHRVLRPRVA